MEQTNLVRTRFAPSPTGFLHVGGVRTALFAWLVAKQSGGQFILRLEDTDKAREVAGSDQHIMDSLAWLCINWDEGPDKGGPWGPYRQSERLEIYKEWAGKLIENGRAYVDTSTPEQLELWRNEAKLAKKPFLFRNHRPTNPPLWDGRAPLRFKSEPRQYQWHDLVMGDLSAGDEAVDDFVIIKSDGYPTYNFAHIVDDQLMQISHVIRSQEFLASVPKYLNLYAALQIEIPKLATLPYVMGPDGQKKLSKRDGSKDILDYRRDGYLPQAIISFLATLGWNDGTEQEIFSTEELLSKFSLERVQKSGARFDEQRLTWTNGSLIRSLSAEDLQALAEDFFGEPAKSADKSYKNAVLSLVQERLKFLSEIPALTNFFFSEPDIVSVLKLYTQPTDKQLQGIPLKDIASMLGKTLEQLEKSDFSTEDIAKRLNQLLSDLETKPGILFAAIRIALTASSSSPEIFGTISVLGRQKSLSRLQSAVAELEK